MEKFQNPCEILLKMAYDPSKIRKDLSIEKLK